MRVLGLRDVLLVRGTRDERLTAVAERQRWRVRRSQLLAIGLTDNMIETRLRNGRLHRRHAGVYAVGHPGPAELTRETEALLACPDSALLSHLSAASLWGLTAPRNPSSPVDITIPATNTPRHRGIRAHRTSTLDAKDIRTHRGLPVTAPARALLDSAAELTEFELERALDDGLDRDIVRLAEVRDVLDRAGRGRRGAATLGALVTDREGGSGTTGSDPEQRLDRLIRAADLPVPARNVQLERYRPDFVWHDQRLIVEVDSHRWHLRRAKFTSDRKRDADLQAQGWSVLRFTATQVRRQPYMVIARIAQALAWAESRHARPGPAAA